MLSTCYQEVSDKLATSYEFVIGLMKFGQYEVTSVEECIFYDFEYLKTRFFA